MGIQVTDYHTGWPSWTKFKFTRNMSSGYFWRTEKYFDFTDIKIWLSSGVCLLLGEWHFTAGLLLTLVFYPAPKIQHDIGSHCQHPPSWNTDCQPLTALTCLLIRLTAGRAPALILRGPYIMHVISYKNNQEFFPYF